VPEKNTDLSLPKCALGMHNVFTIEEAAVEGDNLFDSLVQGMYRLSIPGGQFYVKSLRQAYFAYAKGNKDSVCYIQVKGHGTE
jgi:hypothetical protein